MSLRKLYKSFLTSLLELNSVRAVNRQPWLPRGMTRRAFPEDLYHCSVRDHLRILFSADLMTRVMQIFEKSGFDPAK